ncbi:helix-turn-helix transcriptional regulator [Flexithrix dorotheae]|uniref:helix-turn-helix transcriptional regulator n=1 Tax=Flexithrix dorotheae TaxID=70993 RepID=UPI000366C41D|nr:helix-turn-helix transcriptional regulator [Flexithrix dorotheae]
MERISKYIEYIWIGENLPIQKPHSSNLTSYPGITPELLVPLDGNIEYQYKNEIIRSSKSVLFSFLHDKIHNDFSLLPRFAIISFKSNAIAGLLPFLSVKPADLIKNPIIEADLIFGDEINRLQKFLSILPSDEIPDEILGFLNQSFSPDYGFIAEQMDEWGDDFSLGNIRKHTKYSYSTIERRFKAETGINPKQYFILRRFKNAVASLVASNNTNWMDYVVKYGYFDQSHFIKEVKRYSGLTPSQVLVEKNLLTYRPDTNFMTRFYNEI